MIDDLNSIINDPPLLKQSYFNYMDDYIEVRDFVETTYSFYSMSKDDFARLTRSIDSWRLIPILLEGEELEIDVGDWAYEEDGVRISGGNKTVRDIINQLGLEGKMVSHIVRTVEKHGENYSFISEVKIY